MATYANIDGYRLEVPRYWPTLTAAEIDSMCNGVGPDDWPAFWRGAVGKVFPWMVPGSKPHDVRYAMIAACLASKQLTVYGARVARRAADKELWRNWCRTIRARLNWRWYDWFCPARRAKFAAEIGLARLAYRAVRTAGAKFAEDGRA